MFISPDRWDTPCFRLYLDDETPIEKIEKAAIDGKLPKEPMSTKVDITPDTNFAHKLDQTCTEVNAEILKK